MELSPQKARVVRDGEEIEIPASALKTGEIVLVKPGEKIPVDGVVIEGHALVDESMFTGESIPAEKAPGDEVFGASLNKQGFLKVKVTRVGEETLLSQIIQMVEEAQRKKAPIQQLVDIVSAYFVGSVIIIATLTLFTWIALGKDFPFAITAATAVLVIACPCALGLATPTALMVGMCNGARRGILFRNSEALQKMEKITTVVFDKTGTLTKGIPKLTAVFSPHLEEKEVLALAASIESRSEHPLAEAILRRTRENSISFPEPQDFEVIPGKGVRARINGENFYLGSPSFVKNFAEIGKFKNTTKSWESDGKTVVYLVKQGEFLAAFGIEDELKEWAVETISLLKRQELKTVMLTGDNSRTAQAIARKAGIDQVFAEVLPQQKAEVIKSLQKEGEFVTMVGDGINDAPALAQADVGIALGSGTDVAIETGDIILVKDDLREVVVAIELAKATVRKVKQNLFWAFFYNSLGIPFAAGIFYPVFHFLLPPEFAALAMALSSVSVVSNSLLLKRFRPLAPAS